MLAIAPVNFAAAACLFVAVLLPERLRWLAWLAAVCGVMFDIRKD